MMPRLRSLPLAALLAALPLALAPLAGCSSTTSTYDASPVATIPAQQGATAAHSSPAATAAASEPASTAPAQPSTPAATPASPATSASPVAAGGQKVFLAQGGDVRGTSEYRPACGSGCQLSGDGTTALWNITWTAWSSTAAAGTGTEKIDDCNPNCAAGTLHAVAVRVALSKPVLVCASGQGTWYWTRVTFTWPNGLPAVFSGDNAPQNPFDYADITAQQAASCS
jgi:hypothetical protein